MSLRYIPATYREVCSSCTTWSKASPSHIREVQAMFCWTLSWRFGSLAASCEDKHEGGRCCDFDGLIVLRIPRLTHRRAGVPATYSRASFPSHAAGRAWGEYVCASAVTVGANAPHGTGRMTAGRWAKAPAGGDLLRVPLAHCEVRRAV